MGSTSDPVAKGPSICANSTSIREAVLDAKLLERFKDALTPDMVDYLVAATNQALLGLHGATPTEIQALAEEQQRVEGELSNLVSFIVKGEVSSPRLGDEIRAREQRLAELDRQQEEFRAAAAPAPLQVSRVWVEERLQELHELLANDPVGARREIQKHIEDLRIAPAPEVGARVVRVTGRAKTDGLLGAEEAVRLQLVAGAGFEPATFGL